MCPLRIILIFLSASLAGFLAWKSFSSREEEMDNLGNHNDENGDASHKSRPLAQACNKVSSGFWTLVDMASGQYLWRNLVGNKNKDAKAS